MTRDIGQMLYVYNLEMSLNRRPVIGAATILAVY